MRFRIRLVPSLIFGAALLLSVRVGGLWDDLTLQVGGVSIAETSKKGTAAKAGKTKKPSAKTVPKGAAKKGDGKNAGKSAEPKVSRRPPPEGDLNEYDLRVLQDLARRRRALDKRERAIALREGMMKAVESRVEQKIGQLKKIQAAIKADLQTVKARRGQRFAKLIKIYTNMKPKDAARVFDKLDLPILVDLLGGMREASSAPILAAMDPAKARQITSGLARRARRGLRRTPKQK